MFSCPSGSTELYYSKSAQLAAGQTLKTAIPGISETTINRFLTVTYTSNAGMYVLQNICTWQNRLLAEFWRSKFPLYNMQIATKVVTQRWSEVRAGHLNLIQRQNATYPSWNARLRPAVTWEVPETLKYTLIILDVGVGIIHGLWTNIEGGSLPGEGLNLDKATVC